MHDIIKIHSTFAEILHECAHSGLGWLSILAIIEINVLKGDALDGHFGQTVAVACRRLTIQTLHIFEGELAKIRRKVIHRSILARPNIFAVPIGIAAIIPHIHNNRRFNTVHKKIFKHNAVDHSEFSTPSA